MRVVLFNFDGLIKNRLGPYALVIKSDDGKYFSPVETWVLSGGYDYSYSSLGEYLLKELNSRACIGAKIFLTTSAGDIELSEKDLRPGIFKEAK
jgi:hypothetical protein